MSLVREGFKLKHAKQRALDFGVLVRNRSQQRESQEVEIRVGRDAFLKLRPDWEALIASDPSSTPYTNWAWVESWIEVYGTQREFLTIVVTNNQKVTAIVPFTWKRFTTPLEIRKLWMLAFDPSLASNGLTEEPIFAMIQDQATRKKLWNRIDQSIQTLVDSGQWDAVAYRRFGQGPESCTLVDFAEDRIGTQQYWRGCEMVTLPADWETYRKSLSKSMRENLSYYRRKFAKDGIDYTIDTVEPDRIGHAIDALVRLHKLRTYSDSAMEHVDYFGDRRQKQLLRRTVAAMVQTGQAKVVTLSVGGQVIAAQVFLQNQNMMLAHYSGFDPAWSQYSPLFVLQSQVFREAVSAGVRSINLLRGNAKWQKRWGATAREQIVDITVSRRSLGPRIRQGLFHHETRVLGRIANIHAIRKVRASLRSWQLARKSA